MNDKKMIHLGYCHSPHGIKGGFTFSLYNKEDSVLASKSKIILTPKKGSSLKEDTEFVIDKISFGNKVITYFENIKDRNEVESLIPFDIYISRLDFPETTDDELYLSDLLGFDVLNLENKKIGEVTNFIDNGFQITLEVKDGSNEYLIPYVDNFVKETDIKNRLLKVIVPEIIE